MNFLGYQLPHDTPIKRSPLAETHYKGWVDSYYHDYLSTYQKDYRNVKGNNSTVFDINNIIWSFKNMTCNLILKKEKNKELFLII